MNVVADEKSANAKILIVDDQRANVELLEMILEMAGYSDVTSVTDPRLVLDLYLERRFDLILLDIRMPHLDGFQVMEQLSAVTRDDNDYLPVLVLTAEKEEETRFRAFELGAKDFINKPFDQAEVLNRIYNMLEVRFLYKERIRQNEILEIKVQERTSELQDRNKELESTRLEIIRRLGRAGEYRDNETGMHVLRMSKSCQRLALAAGFNDSDAERILQASPMHDVGKIGIPDAVLLKPGKLTESEYEVIQTHVEIGGDIIGDQDIGLMRMARAIALTHHEKWDGSGYPNGLKGEEIPIEGRIAAICDVFDALTSARPYKKAWPIEEASAYIEEQAGKHFDPELVRLFNEILPDILAIRDKYADV